MTTPTRRVTIQAGTDWQDVVSIFQSPELSAYLARLNSSDWVWLGSPETQAGIAALVAAAMLTQAEADEVLFIPLPELPE